MSAFPLASSPPLFTAPNSQCDLNIASHSTILTPTPLQGTTPIPSSQEGCGSKAWSPVGAHHSPAAPPASPAGTGPPLGTHSTACGTAAGRSRGGGAQNHAAEAPLPLRYWSTVPRITRAARKLSLDARRASGEEGSGFGSGIRSTFFRPCVELSNEFCTVGGDQHHTPFS